MMIFNCIPDSVMLYVIEDSVVYELDQKVKFWDVNIMTTDGREVNLRLKTQGELDAVQKKLEYTVKAPPATAGFTA